MLMFISSRSSDVGRVSTRHVGLKPDLQFIDFVATAPAKKLSRFDVLVSPGRRSAMQMMQRGFTLIEIMVVVVIMGILAALVAPKLMGRTDDARMIAARQDIATIMQGLKLYRLDNQRYPITEQGLQALIIKPVTGPDANGWKTGGYLDKMPKDPWGNPYQYLSPGIKGEIDVFSLGADGQPGGDGNDADIGSWEL